MSSAKLHPPRYPSTSSTPSNPLPPLIHTPSGLALLELQGEINLPPGSPGDIEIGRIDFPDYVPHAEGSAWMKRVRMHVGQHQRLTGQVKKLPRAVAVIRRREKMMLESSSGPYTEGGENLEVVDIVRYKILFSNRPEPVGTAPGA